ncbi:hypothetical protein A9X01_26870 [Mycobacterium asiaticum]|uniref:PE domain-containing protein n=1 Tax=Mycobacterium asiaticum TaxID=1790 RepID=A0A1A3BV97_MYCAS|nr:hypothetical protein A9X01_26870 [Mycobacterium asiaticum]
MVSLLTVVPEAVDAAATTIAGFGAMVDTASASAATATTIVAAAGADEVSAAIASLFGTHGQAYQQAAAQVRVVHQRFLQALTTSARAYAAAEANNVNPLQALGQELLQVINTPTQVLLGRPLIGDGATGTAAHPTGGDGGLLLGNGGAGYSSTSAGVAGGNGGAAGLIGNGGSVVLVLNQR